jgi:hypothetical protein
MLRFPNRNRTAGTVLAALAGALGGCAAEADLAYGEYRFGPGYQTERVYERRLYGSTTEGLGSEACRVVHRRSVNELGEVVVRRVRICDEAGPYGGAPISAERPRRIYSDPAESALPPADVPSGSGDVWEPG